MCRMVRGLRSLKNCSGSSLKLTSISMTFMNCSAWIRLGRLKRWVTWGAIRASSLKKISPSSSAGFDCLASSQEERMISTSPLSRTSSACPIAVATMAQNHFQASECLGSHEPAMTRSRVVWIAIPMVSRCADRIPREKKWWVVTVRRSFICSGSQRRSRSTVSISQNWVPMASASLLLSLKVALGSFCVPPIIVMPVLSPCFFAPSSNEPLWPPFFLVWDVSVFLPSLPPSFSSSAALAFWELSPCTHSVPDRSILRSELPNFWHVVLFLASSQRSLTTSPCFSASVVTLSMAEQACPQSSVHDLSISAVHSSPTALSRHVTTTWPRTWVCWGLAP
mmetsp:Transcript_37400/g.93863  ORF Transcript_37400/g.93863 Transcript_37400/m.93863 type:complete len:337 (+) Transcript_37400:656-1666(+)